MKSDGHHSSPSAEMAGRVVEHIGYGIKEWATILSIVATVIASYAVLSYRVGQLERALESQTTKYEAMTERVSRLVTLEEVRRGLVPPPGGPSSPPPPNPPTGPAPREQTLDERIEELNERLDRIERDEREREKAAPEPKE